MKEMVPCPAVKDW